MTWEDLEVEFNLLPLQVRQICWGKKCREFVAERIRGAGPRPPALELYREFLLREKQNGDLPTAT